MQDIPERVNSFKWQWAGQVARNSDNWGPLQIECEKSDDADGAPT